MSISTPQRYRRRVSVRFDEPMEMRSPNQPVPAFQSLTEQCHKDECDIHVIMKKFKEQGVITHVNAHKGTYGDYANAPSYHEAQNIIAEAASLFESVPAHIRAAMDNDPQQFVDFMQNPRNRDEMKELGLDTSHLPPLETITPPPASDQPPTLEHPTGPPADPPATP